MPILIIGLNHKTAPLEVRDRVAITSSEMRDTLEQVASGSVAECALLSTCNRTEIYLTAAEIEPAREAIQEFYCARTGLKPAELQKHLYSYQEMDAVSHVYRVAAGLDSMILGEPQIAGQVKEAGAAALEAGTGRTIVNRLFQSAVEASKRARTETDIGVGAVSVSFAAVELARKIFGDLRDRDALVLGAGEMSELTAKHLVENQVRSLMVSSRTFQRAEELAGNVGGRAVDWDRAIESLHEVDMVISSTSAPHYILDQTRLTGVMQRRRNRPMFLIDIAVPRDVDPEVGELYNVFLYDIDDLQAAVGENIEKRKREAEKAAVILEEEVAAFQAWYHSLDVVPAIVALRQHFEELMEAELDKAHLGEPEMEKARNVLRLYMNKLLHTPSVRLKEAAQSGDAIGYVDTLLRLFDLGQASSYGGDGASEARTAKVRN